MTISKVPGVAYPSDLVGHTFEHDKLGIRSEDYPCKNPGVLINNFTSSSGVVFSGATGYAGAVDSSYPSPEGLATAHVTSPLFAGAGYARITLTQNVRFASTDSVSFRLKINNPSAIRYVSLTLIQSSSGATLARATNSDGSYDAGGWGWFTVTWKLSDFTVSGSPNYGADFTSYQFQIGLGGPGGGQGTIALSNFYKNAVSSSYIMFSQDSGYDDTYDVHKYFASSGIPLNIFLRGDTLDTAGYLTTAQVNELYHHSSKCFEIGSYPNYFPCLQHTTTGISLSQGVAGAGNLTLNGALCTAGVANLGAARKVVLSTANVNKTISFTITGTLAGNAVTETILGCWVAGGLVESTYYYDTVTQIAVSAAISGNCTVGTSYSVSELSTAIDTQLGKLRSKGWTGSELNFAYAAGQLGSPLYSALITAGALSGRPNVHTQTVPRNMLLQDAAFNPLLLSAVNAATAIATLKSMVDDIVSRGGLLVIYFHQIAATVDGINVTAEDLAELVSYCKTYGEQGKLKCLKFSDLNRIVANKTNV